MAVVDWVVDNPTGAGEAFPEGVRVIKWTLASGDTGTPYTAPHRSDKSVQVTGTAGAGTTVRMEGTNVVTGTAAWGILNDPSSAALSWNDADITASKVEQVLENTWQIRPNYVAGSASGVVVRMLVSTVARRG
jgi:hypothetical protein